MLEQSKIYIAKGIFFAFKCMVPFRGLFRRLNPRKDVERFLRQYHSHGLSLLQQEERDAFPRVQSCVNCGLCASSCAALESGIAPREFHPRAIPLNSGRSFAESEAALEDWLPCLQCECTVTCPTGVPIHSIAKWIHARRKGVGFRRRDGV